MKAIDTDRVIADVSSWGPGHWTALLLFFAVAMANVYVGHAEAETPLLLVGSSFALGALLFASRFWGPILYLLTALHVGVLGVIWVLDGMPFFAFGVVTGCLSVGLAAVSVYLLVEESTVGR